MSSLISYAKAFNLPTTQDMSHIEIATLVAKYEWGSVFDGQPFSVEHDRRGKSDPGLLRKDRNRRVCPRGVKGRLRTIPLQR